MKNQREEVEGEQTFDFEFGVPGVAVPPGIFDDSLIPPWLPLPFEMGVLNVVTDDCVMVKQQCIPSTVSENVRMICICTHVKRARHQNREKKMNKKKKETHIRLIMGCTLAGVDWIGLNTEK